MSAEQIRKLMELKNALQKLQKFVSYFSGGDRPYFYRMLNYMENNIELYFKVDGRDLTSLEEILYRDWQAANNLWYGLPSFQISKKVCEENVELYYYYALLIREIEDYFES